MATTRPTSARYVESPWGLYARDRRHDRAAVERAYAEAAALGGPRVRAWAELGLGLEAAAAGELPSARARLACARRLFGETDERAGLGWVLTNLGLVARAQGRSRRTCRRYFEQSVALWDEVGDWWGRGAALRALANAEYVLGNHARAAALYHRQLTLLRDLRVGSALAWSLNARGEVLRAAGDMDGAAACYQESLTLFRNLGGREGVAWTLHNLALVRRAGDRREAADRLGQSLALFAELEHMPGVAACLAAAGALVGDDEPLVGAALFGAAEGWLARAAASLEPADAQVHERSVAQLRGRVKAADWRRAHREGAAWGHRRAVAEALRAVGRIAATGSPDAPDAWASLTAREREVADLVALGLSNGEIARRLVISEGTVKNHLEPVFRKLRCARAASWPRCGAVLTGRYPQSDSAGRSCASYDRVRSLQEGLCLRFVPR